MFLNDAFRVTVQPVVMQDTVMVMEMVNMEGAVPTGAHKEVLNGRDKDTTRDTDTTVMGADTEAEEPLIIICHAIAPIVFMFRDFRPMPKKMKFPHSFVERERF